MRGHSDTSRPLRSPREAATAQATRKKKQASGERASKQSQHATVAAVLAGAVGLGMPLEVGLDGVALAAARAAVLAGGVEAFACEGAARGVIGEESDPQKYAERGTRDMSLRNFAMILGELLEAEFFFLN